MSQYISSGMAGTTIFTRRNWCEFLCKKSNLGLLYLAIFYGTQRDKWVNLLSAKKADDKIYICKLKEMFCLSYIVYYTEYSKTRGQTM